MVFLYLIIFSLKLDACWLLHYARKTFSPVLLRENCEAIERIAPNPCSSDAFSQYCASQCRGSKLKKLKCYTREKIVSRIVGGENSVEGQWPWHVSLRIKDKQWCSGSVITNRYILTAAHCFDPSYTSTIASDWRVLTGDYLLSSKDYNEVVHKVKKIIIHEKFEMKLFNKGNSGLFSVGFNDIALLELENPIESNLFDDGGFLCLPDKNYLSANDGDMCRIVGWGHRAFNSTDQPETLQNAFVPIVSNVICNEAKAYNKIINKNYLLCAGYPGGKVDACNFDSGGALACEKNELWFAAGIVSSGFECANPHSYGLYSNVATYKNWIIEAILLS